MHKSAVLSIALGLVVVGGSLRSEENWPQFRGPTDLGMTTERNLAVNDLGDGNHASPAVAGGDMFLVGAMNVYCIGTKK